MYINTNTYKYSYIPFLIYYDWNLLHMFIVIFWFALFLYFYLFANTCNKNFAKGKYIYEKEYKFEFYISYFKNSLFFRVKKDDHSWYKHLLLFSICQIQIFDKLLLKKDISNADLVICSSICTFLLNFTNKI